ncbi:MAG: phosphodiesterase [Pseudomonas sp.]
MNYLLPLTLTAALFTVASVQADTLSIPLGQQASSQQISLPQRGTSTSQVQRQHGEPTTRHAAIGQPPISRWDYPGYSVYFEYDHVIHAVRQHTPRSN